MAKRHNMCWDKRHSCTPIKTIFCLAYIITYIMTFRLPFFLAHPVYHIWICCDMCSAPSPLLLPQPATIATV